MDCDTIDLDLAERAVSLLADNEQQGYEPETLQQRNSGRLAYLPMFPRKTPDSNKYLLLANIPG